MPPVAEIGYATASVLDGPGISHRLAGTLKKGDLVQILGIAPDGAWLMIEAAQGPLRGWVSKGVVSEESIPTGLPTIVFVTSTATEVPPSSTPLPTWTQAPTATRRPKLTAAPTLMPAPVLNVTIGVINELDVDLYLQLSGPIDTFSP